MESRLYHRSLATEQAVETLQKAITLQPNRSELYLEAAQEAKALYLFTGLSKWDEKRRHFLETAVRVSPYRVEPRLAVAEYYQEHNEFERAGDELKFVSSLTPHRSDVSYRTALWGVRQKDFVLAADVLASSVGQAKGREYLLLRGVLAQLSDEHPGEASKLLAKWRKTSERGVWVSSLLSEVASRALKEENWPVADLALREAMFYKPEDLCLKVQSAQVVGALTGEQNELAALKPFVHEAVELKGDCAKALLERYAVLLKRVEGAERLCKFLDEQVDTYPRLSLYRIWLADEWAEQGRLREAQEVLREGLDLGARSNLLTYKLGEMYEKSGAHTLAAGYYRQVLQEEPNHSGAKSGLKRVAPRREKPKVTRTF